MLDVGAVVAIQQLVARYAHVADQAKFQPPDSPAQRDVALIFTMDAQFDGSAVGLGVSDGIDAIRRMFARPWPHHPPHHSSSNVFVEEFEGEVHVISKWNVVDWDGTPRLGSYRDVVVETPDGWRIHRRVVHQAWGQATGRRGSEDDAERDDDPGTSGGAR